MLWLLATSATTAVAFWAVSTANSEVSQRPLTAVVASAPTSASVTSTPTTTLVTSTPTTPTSTTTTAATSAAPAEWTQTTVNSDGGSIIVSYRPSEVRLESVAPRAGFTFEIDDASPGRVRVEFLGEDVTYSLRAEWTDEGFVTEVDSSGEGSGG